MLVWQFYPGFWKSPPEAALAGAVARREALRQAHVGEPAAVAAPAQVQALAVRGPCDFAPLLPPRSAADGRLRMEHPFPASPAAKAKVFMRKAQGAAASGRARDVEVALIAACRYDAQASKAPTVPLARVLGLLGEHYRAAAIDEDSPGLREELIARAREVLTVSAVTYDRALGPNAARSREAHRRLAGLDENLIAAIDAPQPARQEPLTATRPPRLQKARAAPARETAAPAVEEPRARGPSDARVRQDAQGSPAPLDRSDPELRQLAADLERLRLQAGAVSEDPEGMRRRSELAERQREQCRDAACLRQWYAHRRQELLAEF
ncbi:hypothetical protein [Ramlibacter sp. AN1133]|uniref:hypothetical protein n=1 Tax=Ramlibacter sp. AN1133 TaxID=3133429 RepID=UPI0030C20ACE